MTVNQDQENHLSLKLSAMNLKSPKAGLAPVAHMEETFLSSIQSPTKDTKLNSAQDQHGKQTIPAVNIPQDVGIRKHANGRPLTSDRATNDQYLFSVFNDNLGSSQPVGMPSTDIWKNVPRISSLGGRNHLALSISPGKANGNLGTYHGLPEAKSAPPFDSLRYEEEVSRSYGIPSATIDAPSPFSDIFLSPYTTPISLFTCDSDFATDTSATSPMDSPSFRARYFSTSFITPSKVNPDTSEMSLELKGEESATSSKEEVKLSKSSANSKARMPLSWEELFEISSLHEGRIPRIDQIAPMISNAEMEKAPVLNTGNQGPMVVQVGDWKCGSCAFVNWRRRMVCMRCFPLANQFVTNKNGQRVKPLTEAEKKEKEASRKNRKKKTAKSNKPTSPAPVFHVTPFVTWEQLPRH